MGAKILIGMMAALILIGAGNISIAREFTDAEGRKIEAELVAVRGENATVKRADGRTFTFPIKKLSEADQKYIATWKAANPQISFGYRLTKNMESRSKGNKRTTENWNFEVEIENRGFDDLKGLKFDYLVYVTIRDRYAKGKKSKTVPASKGTLPVDKLAAGQKRKVKTGNIKVESVNSVTESGTTVTYEKWDEKISGIVIQASMGGRVVDTYTYGDVK